MSRLDMCVRLRDGAPSWMDTHTGVGECLLYKQMTCAYPSIWWWVAMCRGKTLGSPPVPGICAHSGLLSLSEHAVRLDLVLNEVWIGLMVWVCFVFLRLLSNRF